VKLFECVPNVSEGRDAAIVDACAQAIVEKGATLAHRTSDPVHHRSVFTFFGSRDVVLEAAVALAHVTTREIDLRAHRGEHPRIGALDVVPIVPLGDATMDDAAALAREVAGRIWAETRTPAYLYGAAATRDEHRHLATVRSGEFEGLGARPARGLRPDVGDIPLHESAGAVAVGARGLLIAFNVTLRTGDLRLARRIARTLRERDGGLRTLRALGFRLDENRVQVSFNVTDYRALPLDLLVALVRRMAERHGVAVEASELIGLLPRAALEIVVSRRLGLPPNAEVSAASAQ
jgi:glutamate formiminotransferase